MNEAHIDAAIDWLVLLRSGEATSSEQQAFAEWLAAHASHAAAWVKVSGTLERSLAPLKQAGAPDERRQIERSLLRPSRRRALRGMLGLAALGAGSAAVFNRITPIATLMTDLRTGTGQRRSFTLDDGSTLLLNARSAVDVQFTAQQRLIQLREGELLATVAADAGRPFIVSTEHGSARALGTRFMMRRAPESSLALVLEHSVRINNASNAQTLRAGESAWFDRARIQRNTEDLSSQAAWERGMLVANDQPLGEVIGRLRDYRKGFIRVSPAAAQLRVLGAFPLDDTDRVIESLAQTLPIDVTVHGSGWLVRIEART